MEQQENATSKVFDDFVKDYKSGKMSALVGAGFSRNVSNTYQSWNGLLWDVYKVVYEDEISSYRIQVEDSLMKNAQKQLKEGEVLTEEKLKNIKANVDKQVDDYIYSRIKKENLLMLVSKYIEKVGYREAIDSYIENRTPYAIKGEDGKYYLRYFKKQSEPVAVEENMFSAHRSLLRCREFLNIYTTNYDNLLEFTAEHLIKNCIFNPSPISNAESLSDSINKRSIIKIHGSLRTPEDKDFVFDSDHNIRYIIAQEDYTSYIEKHEAFSYLMRIAMLSGTFCLIGFSGSDPNYRNWVNWMKDIICKNPDTGNKVYLIDVDAKKDEKNADMLDSEELFNDNHRVKVIHLYEEDILEKIMGIAWKRRDEKDKLIIPERREMLTALFDYLSRTSSANILESESNSNNPNIQYAIGILYYQGENKDIQKAIEHFEKAKDLDSKEAKSKLAECYYYKRDQEGYFDKAIELCNEDGVEINSRLLFAIALCYWNGNGVPEDKAQAVKWFTKAAEQGDADAQYILGICYDNGDGVTEDKSEAVKWYTKAAEQGDAKAQCILGICYDKGDGVTEDKSEAVKWYTKAAEQGLAQAQYILGICYENGDGVTEDKAEAVKWFAKAAEQGLAKAQCSLGFCYEEGEGVTEDKSEAVKWYTKAAEQGHAGAQCNLGVCYENGYGVTEDKTEAVKWYTKAAEQGDAQAQFNLALCYYKGECVPEDKSEAVKWFTKAAEQGHAGAQCNLGNSYFNGYGVSEDKAEAVKWFTKAAEQGHISAQYILAMCYENGDGVTEDKSEAVKWYTKAAEQGDADAQNGLAWLLHTSGKDQEALPWIEKALEKVPNDAFFVDTLAEVYQGLGRLPEALEQFEKCLAIFKEEGNEKFVKETEEKIRKLKELMG